MHYLLASILASTSILVLFRWMQNSKAVTRHAIVVSYLGSVIAGMLLFDVDWSLVTRGWFLPAAAEGVGFYVVFRMIALATQRSGITVASIATKMSVVIPTLIGIVALGESVSIFKVAGLLAGTLAVFLAVGLKFKGSTQLKAIGWGLPALVFICTGLIDASLKLFQVWGLTDSQFPGFVVTIFGFAFLAATSHHMLLPNRMVNRVSIVSGILLGLANLGTVYFLLKALSVPSWESSIVYPLNNFGIVLASTLVAVLFFGERLTTSVRLSLCFATGSIVLLYAAG